MEPWNQTVAAAKLSWSLSNCTVDTSYRFTFYQVSYSIIFLLGLVTNGLALHRLCRSRCTFNSTFVTYMVSLTVADLCFVLSLPLRIFFYYKKAQALSSPGDQSTWTTGVVYCHLTFILKYISLYGGIFFLVGIAVDRYFAVVHPLAPMLRRLRAAQLVSAAIWCLVLGLSVGLPLLRSAAAHGQHPCLLDPSSLQDRTVIVAALAVVQASFVVPTLLLLYCYCRVLSVLRQPRHHQRSRLRSRRHTLTLIYWVLGVFLFCFLPYHVNLLGYTLTHVGVLTHCGLTKVTRAAHPVVLSLASSNCCLNPLVYFFSSSLAQREAPGTGCGSGTGTGGGGGGVGSTSR